MKFMENSMSSGENMGKITTGGLELGKSSRMVDFPAMFDSQRVVSFFLLAVCMCIVVGTSSGDG